MIPLHLLRGNAQQVGAERLFRQVGVREAADGSRFQGYGRGHALVGFGIVEAENVPGQVKPEYLLFAVLGQQVTLDRTAACHKERFCFLSLAEDMLALAVDAPRLLQMIADALVVQQLHAEASAARIADMALVDHVTNLRRVLHPGFSRLG